MSWFFFYILKKILVFVSNVDSVVWLWLEWEGMVNVNLFSKCEDILMFCRGSLILNIGSF